MITKSDSAVLTPAVGLWAIWSYDLMPYICLGQITRVVPHGQYPNADGESIYVETRQFGKGHAFPARRVVTAAEAEKIQKDLKALMLEYDEVTKSLRKSYRDRAVAIHGLTSRGT